MKSDLHVDDLISGFSQTYPAFCTHEPWGLPAHLPGIIHRLIKLLDNSYAINDDIAIHKNASMEIGAIIKPPVIVGEGCFIAAHTYLRGGIFLGRDVSIGPGSELKCCIVNSGSTLAHFNFIGDSIIGADVNFEAGAVIANHYNERAEQNISIRYKNRIIITGTTKFGAIVGDHCRIGANAVLSPGTLLLPGTVVKRLELVEQNAL